MLQVFLQWISSQIYLNNDNDFEKNYMYEYACNGLYVMKYVMCIGLNGDEVFNSCSKIGMRESN